MVVGSQICNLDKRNLQETTLRSEHRDRYNVILLHNLQDVDDGLILGYLDQSAKAYLVHGSEHALRCHART